MGAAAWGANTAAQGLGGLGDRLGNLSSQMAAGAGLMGMGTRFAGLLGMGKFSALGGMGIVAGAPVAGAALAYGMHRGRYDAATQGIERFRFGEDRMAAFAQAQAWRRRVGNKAPVSLMDRFWLGAYKESGGQVPWMDRAVMEFGTPGDWAERTGRSLEKWSTVGGFLEDWGQRLAWIGSQTPIYRAGDQIVQAFRRMF